MRVSETTFNSLVIYWLFISSLVKDIWVTFQMRTSGPYHTLFPPNENSLMASEVQ